MILNWNKSLREKNDKILWSLSLKNILGMKDGDGKERGGMGGKEERDYWCFHQETPTAGLGSLLCFLCLSLVLFHSLLPSITHSAAVSYGLTHFLLCLHFHSLLFLLLACCISTATCPQSCYFDASFNFSHNSRELESCEAPHSHFHGFETVISIAATSVSMTVFNKNRW